MSFFESITTENSPLVVATVTSTDDLVFLSQNNCPEGIDVLEFRLDNLIGNLDEVEASAKKLDSVGRLFTARHPAEGGIGDLDETTRFDLLRRFLPLANLIDIEVQSLEAAGKLVQEAQDSGTQVIASFHNFEETPTIQEVAAAVSKTIELGADIAKIAAFLDEMPKMFELVAMLQASNLPMSVMGMGPLGKLSRLVFAKGGSVLNYGFLQTPNAPGQWRATELKRLLGEIAE